MQIPHSRSVRQISEPLTLDNGDVIEVALQDGIHYLLLNRYPMSAIVPDRPELLIGDYQNAFYSEIKGLLDGLPLSGDSTQHAAHLAAPANAQPTAPNLAPTRILHLGVAGGALARTIHANYASTHNLIQVGYDISEPLISYAREHFGLLKSPALKVRLKSAEHAVQEVPDGSQHAIVLDIYDEEGNLPAQFLKPEFIVGMLAKLAINGMFLANIIDSDKSPDVVTGIKHLVCHAGGYQCNVRKLPNKLSIGKVAYVVSVARA